MSKLEIFEPAMCCPTGVCAVEADPELLRISTVLHTMEKNGVKVERFNLSNSPQDFIKNTAVTDFIRTNGVEALPVIILDGEIVIRGRYPKNEEFAGLLNIPLSYTVSQQAEEQCDCEASEEECCGGGCCCSEGCCSEGCC